MKAEGAKVRSKVALPSGEFGFYCQYDAKPIKGLKEESNNTQLVCLETLAASWEQTI